MSSRLAMLGLLGCGGSFDDYYADPAAFPALTGVAPASVVGVSGGQAITLTGARLGDVHTVVFGTRNAEIVSASDTSLTVIAPAYVAGGGPVEVAVASPGGIGRLDGAFTYERTAGDFVDDEAVSAQLTVVDCPIEAAGDAWWCGLEMGFLDASAWEGAGRQPGYAGEMSVAGSIGALPEVGTARVYGRGDALPPAPGDFFKYLPFDGTVTFATPRDFERDLDWITERSAMRAVYYSYEPDVTDVSAPYVTGNVADESVCFELADVESADGDVLVVDGDPSAWDSLDLWYDVEEQGGYYLTEGVFAGAPVLDATSDGRVTGGPSGVVLEYDDYSGLYVPDALRWPGGSDLPFGATYTVSTHRLESGDTVRGDVVGVERLTGLVPDLMSGEEVLDLTGDVVFTWDPRTTPAGGDPEVVAVEIRVYDTSVTDPATGYWAEMARLVGQGDDAAGRLVLTPAMTAGLPHAPLTLDDNYDFTGRFAEVTVARHQLRRVPFDDGTTLVVDFVHAIQAPVSLARP